MKKPFLFSLMGCFIALGLPTGCSLLPDLDILEIIEITASVDTIVSIDSVIVRGEIKNLSDLPDGVESFGIIWTTEEDTLLFQSAERIERIGSLSKSDSQVFDYKLRLDPNRIYKIRAYATADDIRYFYSDVITHMTGNGMAITDSIIYRGGFRMTATGRLLGFEKDGISVIQHGFCWSKTSDDPKFNADTVQLGIRNNDATFEYSISVDSTAEIIPYYVRSYAVTQNSVGEITPIFGAVLKFDGDLSFWTRIADYPGLASIGAVSFAFDEVNRAYVGTGRDVSQDKWATTAPTKDFYKYNPEADIWEPIKEFPGVVRIDAASFTISTKAYVGIGLWFPTYSKSTYHNDLWEYDPVMDTWANKQSLTHNQRRSEAIGFSIDDTAYLVLGALYDQKVADLVPYNPATNSWGPGFLFGNSHPEANFLRRGNPVGFTINNKAYIGAGVQGSSLFSDLWEYDPASECQKSDPVLVCWKKKSDMPNPGTAAFVLNHKAYVSAPPPSVGVIGSSSNVEWNFFSYDPAIDTWTREAEAPIHADVAFTLNGVGYIGLGTDKNGNFVKEFYKFNP